jgi:hypothetical protein
MEGVSELTAVDECTLPDGFRATDLTRPVCVIDGAVLAVAGVRATDTLVIRWECLKDAIVDHGCDRSHVLAERASVDVVWAGTCHRVARHVVQRHDVSFGTKIEVCHIPVGESRV